jgi:hypothetical protein
MPAFSKPAPTAGCSSSQRRPKMGSRRLQHGEFSRFRAGQHGVTLAAMGDQSQA